MQAVKSRAGPQWLVSTAFSFDQETEPWRGFLFISQQQAPQSSLLTTVGASFFPEAGIGFGHCHSPLGAALRKESCVFVKFILKLSHPCPSSTKGPLTSPARWSPDEVLSRGGALWPWPLSFQECALDFPLAARRGKRPVCPFLSLTTVSVTSL